MLPERALPGIDYCEHAASGTLPAWGTIRGCPICARRWRIAEARRGGWPPLPREEALALIAPLAAALVADGGHVADETERRFYAHLAITPDDEADFAAAVAAARDSREELSPPGDFGWRALFSDRRNAAPSSAHATLTRVWQWRAIGTARAVEGRTFVAGDPIPPFSQPPPSPRTMGRWLREGAGRDAPLLQQILGPLLLTLSADPTDSMVTANLRLRDHAQGTAVPTRLYLGADAARRLVWSGTLSEEVQEQVLQIHRDARAILTIEIDTTW